MKILSVDQIRALDAFTIKHEPVSSLDLMERAAGKCCEWILDHFGNFSQATVLCGPGNNGGDGLVIARLLGAGGWDVNVVFRESGGKSDDFRANLGRLEGTSNARILALRDSDPLPAISQEALIIDALFGSGLSRPLEGPFDNWVSAINQMSNIIIAIDIPSGLFADRPTDGTAVEADFTLSFQVPKKAFFIPENQEFTGDWVILPIGLHEEALRAAETHLHLLDMSDIAPLLKPRKKFDHKGIYGHALIVAGSYGKAGAAVLATRAALHAGVGLVSTHVPGDLNVILQTAVPEAMVDTDDHPRHFTHLHDPGNYTVIGGGCGLGEDEETIKGFSALLGNTTRPMVLDADALNIIGKTPALLEKIPPGSILTPHFKEFERMFGPSGNHFERLEKLQAAAQKYGVVIVLKGAHTAVATPDGSISFNATGNPGMATAGSGDVLAGLLTGLVGQGYDTASAAKLGVWLHGLAGDLAAEATGEEALTAGILVDYFGPAFQSLHAHRMHE